MIPLSARRFRAFTPGAAAALAALALLCLLRAPAQAQRYRIATPEEASLLQTPFTIDLGGAALENADTPAAPPSRAIGEPPPPGTALDRHVNDSAGLILEAIETRLEEEFQLRAAKDGVHLYFVTTLKAPSAAADYVASLCDATLPAKNQAVGGVLLLESSPFRITVSLSAKARLLIPDGAVAELIDKAVADQPEDVAPGALLAFTGRRLADRLRILEEERSEAARIRNTALIAGGGVLGLVLLIVFIRGVLAMWIRNLFDRRYYFTEAQMPERLGAMFSGGHSATINFRRK